MKKLTFFEALAKVAGTSRALRRNKDDWMIYKTGNGTLRNKEFTGNDWWPEFKSQKAKIWEVEPEAIYVWARGNGVNESRIWLTDPHTTSSKYPDIDDGRRSPFPKDKLQKYELVPVED